MSFKTVVFCGWVLSAAAAAGSQAPTCAIEAPEWAPRGWSRSARPRISVTLASTCGVAIDAASIRMTVDDQAVMPRVEGTGPKVMVFYVPESALVEEEDHTVVVQARDVKGTAGEKSWTFYIAETYLK